MATEQLTSSGCSTKTTIDASFVGCHDESREVSDCKHQDRTTVRQQTEHAETRLRAVDRYGSMQLFLDQPILTSLCKVPAAHRVLDVDESNEFSAECVDEQRVHFDSADLAKLIDLFHCRQRKPDV